MPLPEMSLRGRKNKQTNNVWLVHPVQKSQASLQSTSILGHMKRILDVVQENTAKAVEMKDAQKSVEVAKGKKEERKEQISLILKEKISAVMEENLSVL